MPKRSSPLEIAAVVIAIILVIGLIFTLVNLSMQRSIPQVAVQAVSERVVATVSPTKQSGSLPATVTSLTPIPPTNTPSIPSTSIPSTSVPCTAQEYINATKSIYTTWTDAVQLTGNTQRINLPPQIEKLQGLRREFQNVSVPDCAQTAHAMLLQGMNDTIRAYLDFLAQRDEERTIALLQLAKQYEAVFQAEQNRLQQIASGHSPAPISTLPLYQTMSGDTIRGMYDSNGYDMKFRPLDNGRIAFNGTKDGIVVELVIDQGNLVQVYLLTSKASENQLIAAAKIAFPEWVDTDWERVTTAQTFIGRTFVHFEETHDSKSINFDLL